MYTDEICYSCDYISDYLVDYMIDDGSALVHICLDCNEKLVTDSVRN
jgi:hypothetical protein